MLSPVWEVEVRDELVEVSSQFHVLSSLLGVPLCRALFPASGLCASLCHFDDL